MQLLATSTNIPLAINVVAENGKLAEPWVYFFEHLRASLPDFGISYVLDESAESYAPLIIGQGPLSSRDLTPVMGSVFIATDTKDIYIETSGNWTLLSGALTGDITKPVGSTGTVLATVLTTPGTFGSANSIPVLQINGKGLVTSASVVSVGNATTATALATAQAINGVPFDGTAPITITAAAGTLTGSTLASGVTASSLTSVGTLGSVTTSGNVVLTGANQLQMTAAGTLLINATNLTGEIALRTNGVERMRINSSGNVGIGATPSSLLHIKGGSAPIRMEATGGTPRTYAIGVNFVAGVGEFSIYDYTAGAERVRIDVAGILTLAALPALNYASDALAAAGGVPIGALYHNAGAVKVRLV